MLTFDRFILDPADERLVGPDGPIRLGNKAFQVLSLLAAQPGRLLTKDSLFAQVWDGAAVSDSALTSVIKELRRALGDDRREPRFIESVYGRGYRFLPAVTPAESVGDPPSRARPQPQIAAPAQDPPRTSFTGKLRVAAAVVSALAACIALATQLGGREEAAAPIAAPGAKLQVRLASFEELSPDVPGSLAEAVREETIAAFAGDGTVAASTAPAPPPGTGPAYSLHGSVRRDGDALRVVSRLQNDRTGATLWSHSQPYPLATASRIPRMVAIVAGNMVRCGLYGASTYPGQLPDKTLSLYLQACHYRGLVESRPERALHAARQVVRDAPDFSWGWSMLQLTAQRAMRSQPPDQAEALEVEARRAAATALRLDPGNSEALVHNALFLDPNDLAAREHLFEKAVAAEPLACGCEHKYQGIFFSETGRIADAVRSFRRSSDILPLDYASHLSLALVLLETGAQLEAKRHLAAAAELAPFPNAIGSITLNSALLTGDHAAAARVLRVIDSRSPTERSIWLAAFQALAARDRAAMAAAVPALAQSARDPATTRVLTISLLAALGAPEEALAGVRTLGMASPLDARRLLMSRMMRNVQELPGFVAVAEELGLLRYWRQSRHPPDVCTASGAPGFCRVI